MIKKKIFLLSAIVLMAFVVCPQNTFSKQKAKRSEQYTYSEAYELSIRYINLSRGYRSSGDVDNAFKYIKKSKALLTSLKATNSVRYWTAAADVELFYLCCDIQQYELAEKHIDNAYTIYKQVIKQVDGSPIPIGAIRDDFKKGIFPPYKIDYNNNTFNNNCGQVAGLTEGDDDWDSPKQHEQGQCKRDGKSCAKGTITGKVVSGGGDYYDDENVENHDRYKDRNSGGLQFSSDATNVSANSCRLNEIPRDIYALKGLKHLSLADNKINKADLTGLASVSGLEYLDLSNNRITDFNGDFSAMKNLKYLDLSGNTRLKTLPAGLEKVRSLKILNITNCDLSFETISNLIRKLSDTQVIFDPYVKEDEETEDDENW